MKNSVDAERVCGFYVSNMHFATMILPFINREIKEETNFITFFELNQKSNINTVLSGVVANLEDKEKIIKIDWGDTKILKISDVEKKIKNISTGNNIILVCGREEYIDMVNSYINKYIDKNRKKLANLQIKIIDCFEVNSFNENIRQILATHNKIINTSGEHEISEIFEGYNSNAG